MILTEIKPSEMNRGLIDIFDNMIINRLNEYDIGGEMDLQVVIYSELAHAGLIGRENKCWKCYQDMKLLRDNSRFDLVLVRYPYSNEPKKHYPSIVAELKVWNSSLSMFENDFSKLNELLGGKYPKHNDKRDNNPNGFLDIPDYLHLYYIVDIKSKRSKEAWRERLKKIPKEHEVKIIDIFRKPRDIADDDFFYSSEEIVDGEKSYNNFIKEATYRQSWCRFNGDAKEMEWLEKKNRIIVIIRVSRTVKK